MTAALTPLRQRAVAPEAGALPANAFLAGARDITPMVIGVVPFGLAVGAAAGASSLTTLQSLVSGPAILAGAAQVTTIEMLDASAGPAVIVLSALMINARILLYSASLATWFRDEPLGRRILLALPVIDQLHHTCVPRFTAGDLDERDRRRYYTGAAVWLVGAWVLSQVLAITLGAQLPEAAGLRIAAPLALAGLLARSLATERAWTAAVVAAVTAVVGAGLPCNSAVLVAAMAGIVVGSSRPDGEPEPS